MSLGIIPSDAAELVDGGGFVVLFDSDDDGRGDLDAGYFVSAFDECVQFLDGYVAELHFSILIPQPLGQFFRPLDGFLRSILGVLCLLLSGRQRIARLPRHPNRTPDLRRLSVLRRRDRGALFPVQSFHSSISACIALRAMRSFADRLLAFMRLSSRSNHKSQSSACSSTSFCSFASLSKAMATFISCSVVSSSLNGYSL